MKLEPRSLLKGCFLIIAILILQKTGAAQITETIRLGKASFSRMSIESQNDSATLFVCVSTSTGVTNTATATIEVVENTNFDDISYTLTPSRRITLPLTGEGVCTTSRITFKTASNNVKGRTINSRVTLVAVTGGQKGTPDVIENVGLTVNPPQWKCGSSTCQDGRTANLSADCSCQRTSPIIVDVAGDGFDLTDASGGVLFDFNGDGTPEKTAWTKAASDDAFLALDRDGNGKINDGRELFGNFTPQPASDVPNGFLALAEFDKTERGGNEDGLIDERDAVFTSLRLWRDGNHNGVDETGELSSLAQAGLASIDLNYKESKRTDRHGNQFRYRAKVADAKGTKAERWAWDVFLVSEP